MRQSEDVFANGSMQANPVPPLSLHPFWWGASNPMLRGWCHAGSPRPAPLLLMPPPPLLSPPCSLFPQCSFTQAPNPMSSACALSHAWAEQSCSFMPHCLLLVSVSGSESPFAALRSKGEKSTHYPIGAEGGFPMGCGIGHQQRTRARQTARGGDHHI